MSNFPDQNDVFTQQQQALERRRALARSLIEQGMSQDIGQGYQGGKVYIVGNPLANVAAAVGGNYLNNRAESDSQDLARQQQEANQSILSSIPQEQGQERTQAQLQAMQNPSLRDVIAAQLRLDEADAARIERGEQAAADRVARGEQAEAERIDRGEQRAADRVARSDDIRLRAQTPNVNVRVSGGGSPKPPSGYRYNEDGTALVPIPGGPADKPEKPLNEAQGNAYLFGTRADAAHKILDTVGGDYSPMKVSIAGAVDKVPGVNVGANALLNSKEQQVMQAQRDFINAILRKESGAAIAQSEFDNARKQYFPLPGDGPEVIKQKADNRQLAIQGLGKIVGPQGKDIGKPKPEADAVTVKSQAEWQALPPGTPYTLPDGRKGVR